MAMVTLAGLDSRDVQFASTMSVLEDSLELLIERGELDIAADVADALFAASNNPELSHEQKRRTEQALGRFTRPADMRTIAHALRLYEPDSVEYKAARRLIDRMGSLAIEPLLEQLADEPDMGARKMLVDLLAGMATDYIPEMGSHVGDHRWYVVRNVLSILGATHSSAVLPYVERTVRHSDSRVRREAIRALAGIPDRLSSEMMIAALNDEDAGNVQLAARYLGTSGRVAAVPALEQVARGEGRGSREMGPRVEAVEALGKLGAVSSLPTLQAVAGKRTFMRATRGKELRVAAESAIERIQASEGGAS
jgi:HEAT repeat protein